MSLPEIVKKLLDKEKERKANEEELLKKLRKEAPSVSAEQLMAAYRASVSVSKESKI
jgi:hypothetical protein